jgi:hypothetical protein
MAGGLGGASGLGGMAGLGGLGGLGGMGMSPEQMGTVMQNPMVQQMMQQMFSNPELVEQVRTTSRRCIVRTQTKLDSYTLSL